MPYAFAECQLHRVSLRVASYYARALRCYGRGGFVQEGVERESLWTDGQWWDDVIMAILETEFHR